MSNVEETNESNESQIDELGALKLQIHNLSRDYYHSRQELFDIIKRYYNQSITSTYISEESIIALVERCIQIKEEHHKVKKELMEKRPKIKWSFKNGIYSEEIGFDYI